MEHIRMKWMSSYSGDQEKILHISEIKIGEDGREFWTPFAPYTKCPHLAVPDYKIPKGSKGWATYQKLFKAGVKLIAS